MYWKCEELNINKQWGNNWLSVAQESCLAKSINNVQENVSVSSACNFHLKLCFFKRVFYMKIVCFVTKGEGNFFLLLLFSTHCFLPITHKVFGSSSWFSACPWQWFILTCKVNLRLCVLSKNTRQIPCSSSRATEITLALLLRHSSE